MGIDSSDCPAILDRATRPSVCFKTAHYQHTNIFNTKKNFKNYTCLMTIKLSTLQVPKGRKNRQTTGTGRGQRGGKRAVLREAAASVMLCSHLNKKPRAQAAGNSVSSLLPAGRRGGRALLPPLYSPHPCGRPSVVRRGQTCRPESQEALLF